MQQVFVILGGGTDLAACAVNHGTGQKIEEWLRAHPHFGSGSTGVHVTAAALPPAPGSSVADEIAKLVSLRDVGALTDEEFATAKARLLS